MKNTTILQRLFKLKSNVTLWQWIYESLAKIWPTLSAAFIAAGGMTYLSAITSWTAELGVAGIGGIGLIFGLLTYYILTAARLNLTNAHKNQTLSLATEKWANQVDSINPLDTEFHKKRINLSDLAHPITNKIRGKKFVDCELIGPECIFLMGGSAIGCVFLNCDLILMKDDARIMNIIVMENCDLIGGALIRCTIYINPSNIDQFKNLPGVNFVTETSLPINQNP